MHPEIIQSASGSCPKCGIALEVVSFSASEPVAMEYICPMVPEVVSSRPGACPKCGMALEPRKVSMDKEENIELRDMNRRFQISLVFLHSTFDNRHGLYATR